MKRIGTHGFTLIELMVTVAVFAIFAAIAIPNFTSVIQDTRLQGVGVNLVTAFNLARSEAIKRGQTVDVKATDGNSWTNGFTVEVSGATTPLRTFPGLTNGITITAATNGSTSISYLASGLISTAGDTFQVCDSRRTGETGRAINVNATGRISTTTYACN